jgi:hypothetical protein
VNRRAVAAVALWGAGLWISADAAAATGKNGFQVMTLAQSPRQSSLAGTGADAPDADAFTLNPAVLGLMRAPEASFSHASLPLSVGLESLAYVHPLSSSALGARVSLLDAGGFQGYDASGGPTGSVSAKDSLASLAWGRRLGGGDAVGVSLSRVQSAIGSDSASAFGLGLGWIKPLGRLPLRFSASLRNVGSKASFVQDKTGMPQVSAAGLSWRGYNGAALVSAEVRHGSDGTTSVAAGAEGWLYNTLALRAGWDGERDLGGLSLGLGFRLRDFRVDYAFQPGGTAFDAVQRFGLSYRFGGAGERSYQEGLTLSQEGRYPEAIFKFKESLDADPENKEAVRALRQALGALEKETGGDK